MVGVGDLSVGIKICVWLKCEFEMNCDIENNVKFEMRLERICNMVLVSFLFSS